MKTIVLESLFNKVAVLRAPTKIFLVTVAKFIKNNFFYRSLPLAPFDCSNLSEIFQEITASKFQAQHATLFNIYESLCPATKAEIPRGFSNGILQNFRQASFENNFGGLLLERKQRWRRTRSDPRGFRF